MKRIQALIDAIRGKINVNSPYVDLYHKKLSLNANKNNVQSLIIGHSHGQLGLNPKFFDSYAFNFCIGSQDLYYSYNLYKIFAEKLKNLKKVIIVYSVFSPGYELEKSINADLAYFYPALFPIEMKYLKNNLYNKLKFNRRKDFLDKKSFNMSFQGYKIYELNLNEDIAIRDIHAHIKHNLRKNNQTEYINKICKIANQSQQEVVVVIPPHSPIYRKKIIEFAIDSGKDFSNTKEIFEELYELNKKVNFTILNYYADDNFIQDDFSDYEHLNGNGAEKLSKLVNKKIKVATNEY